MPETSVTIDKPCRCWKQRIEITLNILQRAGIRLSAFPACRGLTLRTDHPLFLLRRLLRQPEPFEDFVEIDRERGFDIALYIPSFGHRMNTGGKSPVRDQVTEKVVP
jgi:hypothetical protein